ncbi:MAG: peptidylprolyl isomerase [Sedimenticola sp.]|nr:MAG: peptidylprolyl isomerase [Sedimenticola sp.]
MNISNHEITPGSQVRLHFSLSTADGFEAISTFHEEPAVVTLGQGDLSEGLELALYGLKTGDKQTLLLEADQAFGPRDEGKVQTMDRSDFSADIELEPGLVIGFEAPSGTEVGGMVVELDADSVKVDFNHPLAGKDVVFTVEILEITNPTVTT